VTFSFSSGIKANATDSALTEVLKEFNNYINNGVTDEEMAFMKSAISQRDALQYETPSQKSNFIARLLENHLEGDYIEKQNTIVDNISKATILNLAAKWIQPEKMNIILVGDKAKILPGLQKFGYEIMELDVEGNRK
jgi:zinc protease